MKIPTFLQSTLCGVILTFFFAALVGKESLSAQNSPAKTNWANSMGIVFDDHQGDMCVTLGPDNTVYITMTIYLTNASPQLINSLPPMYFEYDLQADGIPLVSGITDQYLSAEFTSIPGTLPVIYKASKVVPISCASNCNGTATPTGSGFCFKRRTRVITPSNLNGGSWIPYPFGLYPSAWPSQIFPTVTTTFYTCPDLLEVKRVCCYNVNVAIESCDHVPGGGIGGGGLNITNYGNDEPDYAQLHYSSLMSDPVENINAYPNPFDNGFTVRYTQKVPGAVKVECLDTNGRLVKMVETSNLTTGSYETNINGANLTPGVYYLRVSTPVGAEMTKIIKTKN